jgi:dehydrogenase/reductase SDR family member 1
LTSAESPEFVGKAVVALATDSKKLTKTCRIHITGDLASEYGFSDKNGKFLNNFLN